jgi:fatty acid desaturase
MATGACVQESNSSTRLNELPGDGAAPHHSLQPYLHPDPRRSLFQLLNTAIPFAALWYLMLLSLEFSYSRIPNYRLHERLREIDYLQDVTRLTLRDGLRCIPLSLWDEDARRLIAFRDLTK